MLYEELPEDIKIIIQKEVNERFNFKMREFLASIKNIYPFWLQSPDPYTNMIGRNLQEHYTILHDRFKKEIEMPLPNKNISLEKIKTLNNSFEKEFNEKFIDKLRGKIDSRLIYNIYLLMSKYIERSYFL